MNSIKKGALALTVLAVTCLARAQEYTPVIKVAKGQVFTYIMEVQTEVVQSYGGQEMKTTAAQSGTIRDSVANIFDNGSIEVIASFWDVSVNSVIMGQDTVINYDGMIGSPVKMIFDKYGKMTDRIIMEEERQSEYQQLDMDNGLLGQALFFEFPEGSVNPGDKWTSESTDSIEQGSIGGILEVHAIGEYTLGSMTNMGGKSIYPVTYATDMEITGEGNIQGMEVFLEGTGISNGTLYFDPALGVITKNEGIVENDMTVAITGPQSMIIPMTQKSTMNIQLKE